MTNQPSKKSIYTALTGTLLVAMCCFTPILVIMLGAFGLKLFVPYLDFVLLPALTMMIVYGIYSYRRWRVECKRCGPEMSDIE